MAKSGSHYALGLGDMFLAGCKINEPHSSVFSFSSTHLLTEDINKLVSSDVLHVDIDNPKLSEALNLANPESIFIEVNTPNADNKSIELIKQIRLINSTACIFVLVTHTKSYSSTGYYLSGADHCLKLPSDQQKRHDLLAKSLQESHWKSPAKLHLDRTRLLLGSPTIKLDISYTEMTIIDALMQAPEHAMSQDSIAKTLDPNVVFYDPRALEKTISRLRTKIKKAYNLELIFSIRTYGYRLRRATVVG